MMAMYLQGEETVMLNAPLVPVTPDGSALQVKTLVNNMKIFLEIWEDCKEFIAARDVDCFTLDTSLSFAQENTANLRL